MADLLGQQERPKKSLRVVAPNAIPSGAFNPPRGGSERFADGVSENDEDYDVTPIKAGKCEKTVPHKLPTNFLKASGIDHPVEPAEIKNELVLFPKIFTGPGFAEAAGQVGHPRTTVVGEKSVHVIPALGRGVSVMPDVDACLSTKSDGQIEDLRPNVGSPHEGTDDTLLSGQICENIAHSRNEEVCKDKWMNKDQGDKITGGQGVSS